MTLYELALEYSQTAAQVWAHIKELELTKKESTDPRQIQTLDGRIRALRSLYRDTKRIAKYLENYYRKWEPRQGKASQTDHRRRS